MTDISAAADRRIKAALTLEGARLLVAYANESTFVATTFEYLESFARHSRATVRYVHVTSGARIDFNLDAFDVVFQSYCARLPFPGYVSAEFRDRLRVFRGVKLLAVQDEYDYTDLLRTAIRDIGYHVVFTCIPQDQIALVYPPDMFPDTEFITVLTGYVPDAAAASRVVLKPLFERPIVIGYRGRDIGARYGRLAFDKLEIGQHMRDICAARGIPYDIHWTDDSRIYGDAWYDFLASCRAVLGSESGSNVFDFDGSIAARYQALSAQRPAPVSYEEFRSYTDPVEARFDIGQVSPRVFEAASLRTPMILYSGRYSGIIEPDEHYIELKKDFSNIDAVLARLDDLDGLAAMAERAYAHLIASRAFDYSRFIATVEAAAAAKAAELGLLPWRRVRPPLPPEPGVDRVSLASLHETATRYPRHVVHYHYKMQAVENRQNKEQIATLTEAVARLTAELAQVSRVAVPGIVMLLFRGRDAQQRVTRALLRADIILLILRDRVGRAVLRRLFLHPLAGKTFLLAVARLILAQNCTFAGEHGPEPAVLMPRIAGDEVTIFPVPEAVATELNLAEHAGAVLTEAVNRGLTDFELTFGSETRSRPLPIAADSYPLPHLSRWLIEYPKLIADLILGTRSEAAAAPEGLPSSATHYFEFLAAATRYPELVPLLHDVDRRRLGADPAPPFDRPRPPERGIAAQPRRRSVLFLHHCYYNFKYLAGALRDRGWDALVVSVHPPDGPNTKFFHGDDINLYAADPVEFDDRLHHFFDDARERFGIIHVYGVGALSLFPRNWDTDATHAAMPWDILEWRRRGGLIGYSQSGCLDGVAQSSFKAWSPTCCARCPWRERPDICSDAKNLAWGRKVEMLADVICVETDPPLDFKGSPKAFLDPLTFALDPEIWQPNLVPPDHLRRTRAPDDEILVYHGVGNYKIRTSEGVNIKGTHAVAAAVDELRKEGIPIRLDFVDEVPSIDNRYIQAQADIIVDQLNYGRYGATAREGMMLGKPVVARINPWDGDGIAASACIRETPIVNADEGTIKSVLRELALDPAKRAAIGKASREHALKWWSAPRLAERFERVYDTIRATGRPPRTLDQ